MTTKTNKTTDIERLEEMKRRLKVEIKEQEKILDLNLSFVQQNIGGILAGSMLNALKDTLPSGLKAIIAPFGARPASEKKTAGESKPFKISQTLSELLPLAAEIALPMLLGAGMNLVKKKFFKK